MTKYEPTSPEQQVVDALYALQYAREVTDTPAEPAVIGGALFENCSVFRDIKTNNRTVLTELPADPDEFDGAIISVSNAEEGVEMEIGTKLVRASEIIMTATKNMNLRYRKAGARRNRRMTTDDMLPMIEFPSVNPLPVSEYDPRSIPRPDFYNPSIVQSDVDRLAVPKADMYTQSARLVDLADSQRTGASLRQMHFIAEDLTCIGQGRQYNVAIEEEPMIDIRDSGTTDFDRVFTVSFSTKDGGINMLVARPVGSHEPAYLVGNTFTLRIYREGVVLCADNPMHQPERLKLNNTSRGSTRLSVPTNDTKEFFEQLLATATPKQ